MMLSDQRRGLLRAVAFPAAVALILLTAIVGSILHFSTSESDSLALGRQRRLVGIAITQSLAAIAVDQEASTYWDDAVVQTRRRPLDLEWIDNNLGIWFHTYYQHDEAYLLDPGNRSVYAMQNGARAQPTSFHRVATATSPLVDTLRRELAVTYLAPEGAPGQTVGASAISLIGGRPAIVSVKPIVSETGDIAQAPGSEFLHVAVRYLDGSFLPRLSTIYGIDRASFQHSPSGIADFAVRGSDGQTLGFISWAPFQPGEQVEDRMQPVLFAALAVVGLLLSLMLLRLWKSRMELEASRAQAQHLAFHDSLTGLPNRALFEERLDQALLRPDRSAAILLLDLDRFKHVNDTLGHQAGDALIRDFGMRLCSLVREGDTIARLGGDEFAILVDDASSGDVERLAARIVKEVRRPFDLFGNRAHVGVSVGIAMGAGADANRSDLVRKADIALYRAKDAGRDCYRIFTPDMDASVRLRCTVEEELREALGTGRGLCIHYQPQVGSDGSTVGFEALVRWDHPTQGLIAPEQFVPIAEDTGLIVPLGEWVLRQACLASRNWPGLFVAINLSPVQFRAPGFFDRLMTIVRSAGASPAAIQLEVTERLLLDHDDSIRATLARLRAAGFAIVLDDFGTGYSSLSYLRKFEVDKIKIDRSFIQHLGEASDSGPIVAAILALGRALGVSVAAEGVETEAQRLFLEISGCKEMQGYYFSRAVPPEQLGSLADRALPRSKAG